MSNHKLNLTEYQDAAMLTAGDFGSRDMKLAYAAMAVSGEAGEFTDEVKKQLFHGRTPDTYKLIEELGDVLWSVAYACKVLGFDMSVVAELNLAKLQKRYKNGFVPDSDVER